MNDDDFWRLIDLLDWANEGDDEAVVAPLIAELASLTDSDLQTFEDRLIEKLYAIDGRAWARASGDTIWWGEPDSLSVDAFLYARCVVVANGRAFYERVLADPMQMPKDLEFETLLYVAEVAEERMTGRRGGEIRDRSPLSFETFSNSDGWPPN